MLTLILFGALGGVARGLVGYGKYYLKYKDIQFSWRYFAMTVGVSSVVGLMTVWALDGSGLSFGEGIEINPALATIIGYAGGDAIENLYKILFNKPVLGPLAQLR